MLGNKQESCGFCVRPTIEARTEEGTKKQRVQQIEQADQTNPNFGDWMLVTRKKNSIRNGRNCGSNLTHQQLNTFSKENKGKVGNSDNLTPTNLVLTFQFKADPSFRAVGIFENSVAALTSQNFREIRTQAEHGESRKAKLNVNPSLSNYELGSPSTQPTSHGNKKVKLSRPTREKKT